jgi:anthranilate phosphoribosyltransferase
MLETLLVGATASKSLTDEEVVLAVEQLIDAAVLPVAKADFLARLALKGETISEISAFARSLRTKAVAVRLSARTRAQEILDVVGTGGDRLGTFNISTTAALICAAAEVTVAKHGNRGATSRCGSADVLQALGIRIDLAPEAAVRMLEAHGFAFFFAPNYHPAFKHVAPARKLCADRGQRTIFNFLGPLLNPANPSAMLVGVPRPEMCEPLARVLQSLGVRRAMVVCGEVGGQRSEVRGQRAEDRRHQNSGESGLVYLDELSTLGDNTIAEFYQDHGFTVSVLSPEQFPLQSASLDDLQGADCNSNAALVVQLLKGEERGPKRDAVLLNAGAALFVAGRAGSLADGWDLAAETVDKGRALAKLRELQQFSGT